MSVRQLPIELPLAAVLAGSVQGSGHMHSAGSGSGVVPMLVPLLSDYDAPLSVSIAWWPSLTQLQTVGGQELASRIHAAAICSADCDQPILAGLLLSFFGWFTCQFMQGLINYILDSKTNILWA